METTDYNKFEGFLSTELRSQTDERISILFEKIKSVLLDYALKGHSRVKIFVAKTPNSKSISQYNIRLNGYYDGINDPYVKKMLIKKFLADGTKVQIYLAIEIDNNHQYLRKYGGNIIKCKWDKDYSKNSCAIM